MFNNDNYPHQKETYDIMGVAMEVHKIPGSGFSEIVYKDAIVYEFNQRNIFYQREKEYVVNYKGTILPHKFYADFVVFDKVILEIKKRNSRRALCPSH